MGDIASDIGEAPSRISFESACLRFHQFATNLPEIAEKLYMYATSWLLGKRLRELRAEGIHVELPLDGNLEKKLPELPVFGK